MTWEQKQAELWDRVFQATQDVVVLADTIEDSAGGIILRSEMLKSAMNIGRLLVRANAASDKNQFYHYVEESRLATIETDYWLRLAYLLQQREEVQQDLSSIINQYSTIVDLLQKLVRQVPAPTKVRSHSKSRAHHKR